MIVFVATPRLQKPPHPHPYPTSPEATFIPISMLVRFVLAKGISGIIEASATYRFSIPCTLTPGIYHRPSIRLRPHLARPRRMAIVHYRLPKLAYYLLVGLLASPRFTARSR